MGSLADLFDISLDRANQFYTFGWRLSAIGALITMIGIALLWWGTRVRDHDFEEQIATLNAAAGSSRERTATLEVEAARLRLELDREIQKRAPRTLRGEKKEAFVAAIRGKVAAVTVLVEGGWEPRQFATEIEIALSQAGVVIHELEPRPNPAWPTQVARRMVPLPPSTGAFMYAPGFTGNGAGLASDPLFQALMAGEIFGGSFVGPRILEGFNPDEYALYIGEKAPW